MIFFSIINTTVQYNPQLVESMEVEHGVTCYMGLHVRDYMLHGVTCMRLHVTWGCIYEVTCYMGLHV